MIFFIAYILMWLPLRILYPTKLVGKKNLPKKQGYVLTCNHYSNMDALIIDLCLHRKVRFLAKEELFKNKFFGWFLKKIGAYPVNREKPQLSSIKFSVNSLKNNKVLGIFPEGTRNREIGNDQMLELKNGAIMFASKGGTQIVPAMLYRRTRIFRRNYLLIGGPIELEAEDKARLTKEELEKNTQTLANAMNMLKENFDVKKSRKKERVCIDGK